MPAPHAIVIGSGIAGLAAAARLAAGGHRVTVFEAADTWGGKMAEHVEAGYRFDRGPSLFTLPELLDELVTETGGNPRDYYAYRRLEMVCRYAWADGTVFRAWAEPERLEAEAAAVFGEPAQRVRAWRDRSRKLWELTEPIFLRRSLHDPATFWEADWGKTFSGLHRLDPFRTMDAANRRAFRDPRAVQWLNRYATYNGSSPFKAPATLNVIGHLEHNLGAYWPEGGMRRIPETAYRRAVDLGVAFRFAEGVDRIRVEGGRAVGVETRTGFHAADLVFSNMDVVPTYRRLMPDEPAPERTLNQPRSTSALIFYWGMDRAWPELDVHNIFFSDDYPGEFHALTETKTLHDDPTVYVHISSKADPADAPPGGENWFVMINAPHDAGQDWAALRAKARADVLRKLGAMLGTPIEPHIRCEQVLDPPGIQARTSSFLGALYGSSSDNRWAAFLRHANFSRRIRGLYFCGGSVHPGGGIPLSLLSARIAVAQAAKRER